MVSVAFPPICSWGIAWRHAQPQVWSGCRLPRGCPYPCILQRLLQECLLFHSNLFPTFGFWLCFLGENDLIAKGKSSSCWFSLVPSFGGWGKLRLHAAQGLVQDPQPLKAAELMLKPSSPLPSISGAHGSITLPLQKCCAEMHDFKLVQILLHCRTIRDTS